MQRLEEFTRTDWMTFLTGEVLVFGLLGKLLYTYPDKAWLQSLVDADIFAESPLGEAQPDVQRGLELLQSWTQQVQAGIDERAFDDLRADSTRLFVGIDRVLAPPWESVYFSEERLVYQEQTVQVRAWYRRFDVEAVNHSQEPDDHIGLEFAFLAHLAQQTLTALDDVHQVTVATLLAAQREFVAEHLGKWALHWCHLVESQAHTDFFRGIALLARGSLMEVGAVLDVDVQPKVRLSE